ncbi:MAG TPA: hypothetical protein PKI73_03560 [Petrotogaceae bacterium]|nr:hypothetical protein [Petrotogaceae bacterium]
MDAEKKLKTLQMFYAAALADTVFRYGKEGILEKITQEKASEQKNSGKIMVQRFGIEKAEDAFEKTQDLYGCADWKIESTEDGFSAVNSSCMLCNISKKMGSYSPCRIYCLEPIKAMISAVDSESSFEVAETLWESNRCSVSVKKKKK